MFTLMLADAAALGNPDAQVKDFILLMILYAILTFDFPPCLGLLSVSDIQGLHTSYHQS